MDKSNEILWNRYNNIVVTGPMSVRLLYFALSSLEKNALEIQSRAALKNTEEDGKASAVPTGVQEIVAARIDSLDSTAGFVLKVCLRLYKHPCPNNQTQIFSAFVVQITNHTPFTPIRQQRRTYKPS